VSFLLVQLFGHFWSLMQLGQEEAGFLRAPLKEVYVLGMGRHQAGVYLC
jgi:hypothetical protein